LDISTLPRQHASNAARWAFNQQDLIKFKVLSTFLDTSIRVCSVHASLRCADPRRKPKGYAGALSCRILDRGPATTEAMAVAPHSKPMKNSKPTNDNRSIPTVDRLSAQAAAVVR
jgi:hypothetical protein